MRRLLWLSLVSLVAACSSTQGAGTGAGGAGTGAATSGSSTTSSGSGTGGGQPGGACAHPLTEYAGGNGSVTYYTFAMGSSAVSCGFEVLGASPDTVAHIATGKGQHFGAMDAADYAGAAVCGACV